MFTINNLYEGLLLGLANTLFCLGTCAPVLLPFMLDESRGRLFALLQFLGGRLVAYLVFALASGTTGLYFYGRFDPDIFSGLMIVLALWLIISAAGKLFGFQPARHPLCSRLTRFPPGNFLPLYAGIVMGLNVCPPFLLGLDRTLQMGTIIGPILFFLGFYAGSSAWMVLFLFTGKLPDGKAVRITGQLASLLVGLWFLREGVTGFFG